RERIALGVAQHTKKAVGLYIERIDSAIAKVSHQQRVAEGPETGWCECNAPWRIEHSFGRHPVDEMAVGIEHIDEAQSSAFHVILAVGVLLCVGDVQIAVDVLNPEWREALRQIGIDKTAGRRSQVEALIVYVDLSVVKISCVKTLFGSVRAKCESFVNGAVGR